VILPVGGLLREWGELIEPTRDRNKVAEKSYWRLEL